MRDELRRLQAILEQRHEDSFARMVETALSGSDAGVDAFVVSNGLWGGPGSISDQAAWGQDRKDRRQIERVLIDLGELQIRLGKVNVRTGRSVAAFKQWEQQGR